MKVKKKIETLIILVACSLLYSASFAKTNDAVAKNVHHHPAKPISRISNQAYDGVYKSTDGGLTWQRINRGLTSRWIQSLAINPDNPNFLYAGTEGTCSELCGCDSGGVFQSWDAGMTWSLIKGIDRKLQVSTVAIDPKSSRNFYVGTVGWCGEGCGGGNGVFKSDDGARTWGALHDLSDKWVTSFVTNPEQSDILYAGTYGICYDVDGCDKGEGIFKSTNGGATWNVSNIGLSNRYVSSLAINPKNPNTLYAGTVGICLGEDELDNCYKSNVFQSTDAGATWRGLNTGMYGDLEITSLVVDPTSPNIIYAGTSGTYRGHEGAGIYKSIDEGQTWQTVNKGLAHLNIMSLAIDSNYPTTLYAGTSDGVFKSTNGGTNWFATDLKGSVATIVIDSTQAGTLYAGVGYPTTPETGR